MQIPKCNSKDCQYSGCEIETGHRNVVWCDYSNSFPNHKSEYLVGWCQNDFRSTQVEWIRIRPQPYTHANTGRFFTLKLIIAICYYGSEIWTTTTTIAASNNNWKIPLSIVMGHFMHVPAINEVVSGHSKYNCNKYDKNYNNLTLKLPKTNSLYVCLCVFRRQWAPQRPFSSLPPPSSINYLIRISL